MATKTESRTGLIDTDIHERVMYEELLPYLEQPWRRYITDCHWIQEKHMPYTQPAVAGVDRADARVPDGRPAGTDLGFMQEQLLNPNGHEAGILTGALDPSPSSMHGWYEMATALASAYNDWQIDNWLDRDERLYGSVQIAAQDPAGAVREIERVGTHPKMVQVLLPLDDILWGDPYYHPIFEAAEKHNLMIGMHHNEPPVHYGKWPRYFIEWHTLIPVAHMNQVTNLIFNGVFEKFPNLKVMMIEGGFTYVPFLMRKMDQQYKDLRHEVPWVTKKPSETVKEHFCFTTQPLEEMTKKEFLQVIDQMGSEDIVSFSTDYPHWDYDSPTEALPPGLDDTFVRKMLSETARKFYPKLPQKEG
ncbi:putative TIM-barrel fold metal-dependent hydrolase [Salsuginibacillus halophilus]|uniref:Putative TIM-barrel fold metal-dependent hydrolase n=1 Tax=Salsuginibacillus halophilus TaxID=517424 RepID=A0A2P8H8M0_9BACI|nr:amidohydrolase family protein [Salsuginibacillus halophilus]PSL42585.1 putative TIM-barrel fold metal-dependent hydrolase [Salsuginibacillus halophilus]